VAVPLWADYREEMAKHLTQIKKLDGVIVPRETEEEEG